MKKTLAVFALALTALSGCSIAIDGGDWDNHNSNGRSSLSVRTGDNSRAEVVCAQDQQPYSTGGENGEPLVMGCRTADDAPE